MNNDTKYVYLNSRDELLRIDVGSIVYFEADGNYTNIITINKLKGVVCMNLGNIQKMLSETLKEDATIFARVGKKYIINLTFVYSINTVRQQIILSDGRTFAYQMNVSKDALKELKHYFIEKALQ